MMDKILINSTIRTGFMIEIKETEALTSKDSLVISKDNLMEIKDNKVIVI